MIKADAEGKKIILALIDVGVRTGCFQKLEEANRLADSIEPIEDDKE